MSAGNGRAVETNLAFGGSPDGLALAGDGLAGVVAGIVGDFEGEGLGLGHEGRLARAGMPCHEKEGWLKPPECEGLAAQAPPTRSRSMVTLDSDLPGLHRAGSHRRRA